MNRRKKIVAFSILETENFFPLITILNEFLYQRLIYYYSIQINVNEKNKKIFFINFEDKKKDEILRFFNIIHQKLINIRPKIIFLSKDHLENTFLKIISKNLNLDINILKKPELMIKDNGISTYVDIYDLIINVNENDPTFFHDILHLLKNLNRQGYLIINFKRDPIYKINFLCHFIDMRKENNLEHLETEINKFLGYELLKKKKIGISKFHHLLWRLGFSNHTNIFNNFSGLFTNKNYYNFKELSRFNTQFEHRLLKNNLKFKRINQNLLFIEQRYLFYTSHNLDYKLMLKILIKYYSKYFICFLILNEITYDNLRKIEEINLLNNVKLMDPIKFLKLSMDFFRNNVFLKNPQIDSNILSRVVRM